MELPVILVVWNYRSDWLFIENSRMLGNIYGITGLIVGYLKGLAGFEVKL